MSYVSSVINKYGDMSQVKNDAKIINDIIDRQGNTLLLDCIAEYAAKCANKFNLDQKERENLINVLCAELMDGLNERL
jgi:hypothetical protein